MLFRALKIQTITKIGIYRVPVRQSLLFLQTDTDVNLLHCTVSANSFVCVMLMKLRETLHDSSNRRYYVY